MHESEEELRVEALFEKLEAEVAEQRGPSAWLKERPTRIRRLAVLGAALGTLVVAVLLTGRLSFWHGRDAVWTVAALALGVAVVFAVRAGLTPAHRPQWRGSRRGPLAAGLVAVGLVAALVSSDAWAWTPGPMRCLWIGAVSGLPTSLAVMLFDRRPRRGRLLSGVAGGLTGTLVVQLLCPGPAGLAHQLITHFGPTLLLVGGIGGLLGGLEARRVPRELP